jgi:hypothetical protein
MPGDSLIARLCSSHVYQVALIPANCATSLRRKPGVRRRCAVGMPMSAGEMRVRRVRRKSLNSCRLTSPWVISLEPEISTIYTGTKNASGTGFVGLYTFLINILFSSTAPSRPLAVRKLRHAVRPPQPLRSLGSAPARALSGVSPTDRGVHRALFVTASNGAGTGKCCTKGLR